MIPVCPTTDLPSGEARTVAADVPIAVFNVDGTFYAIDDTCTHQDASLADGGSRAARSSARCTHRASTCAPASRPARRPRPRSARTW